MKTPLQKKPLKTRIVYFFISVATWFIILYALKNTAKNNIEKTYDTQSFWILTAVFVTIVWTLLFPKKKP
jgi:DMSO/TMAO reductase YedYZ heme-binding membrane subunit